VTERSREILEQARAATAAYAEHPAVVAIAIGGSVAQGIADEVSDGDVLVYWERVDADWLVTPRAPGERFTWQEVVPGEVWLEQVNLPGGPKIDIASCSLSWTREIVATALAGDDAEAVDMLRGIAEAIPLHHAEAYEERIRSLVATYPDELAVATIQRYLRFSPLWVIEDMGLRRGDLFTFYEWLLKTVRELVGVLAGLNRVFVAPEKLKRVGAVATRFEIAPVELAERLEALFTMPREAVPAALGSLVEETLALVERHESAVDTTRARAIWTLPGSRPT
jgi:hypothetical protein